jgi:hypothetical protein
MRHRSVGVWAVLLLLPMIPVAVFYVVFANQNYFELKEAARGIVTTGPIAAYFALVWLGSRIYKQIPTVAPMDLLAKKLIGTSWRFIAHSFHSTDRQGTFSVTEGKIGDLVFAGNFQDSEGKNVGDWTSTMSRSENDRIQVVYTLKDLSRPSADETTGMLSLTTADKDLKRMIGDWVVLGRAEAHGEISCTRDAASA